MVVHSKVVAAGSKLVNGRLQSRAQDEVAAAFQPKRVSQVLQRGAFGQMKSERLRRAVSQRDGHRNIGARIQQMPGSLQSKVTAQSRAVVNRSIDHRSKERSTDHLPTAVVVPQIVEILPQNRSVAAALNAKVSRQMVGRSQVRNDDAAIEHVTLQLDSMSQDLARGEVEVEGVGIFLQSCRGTQVGEVERCSDVLRIS